MYTQGGKEGEAPNQSNIHIICYVQTTGSYGYAVRVVLRKATHFVSTRHDDFQ